MSSSGGYGLNLTFEVDVLGNITAITPTGSGPEQARTYDYDPLYRLTEVRAANAALIEAFGYDATGNRTSRQKNAGPAQVYTYPPDSHQLGAIDGLARSYDAAGATTTLHGDRGTLGFTYDVQHRLEAASLNFELPWTYRYNGQGERVSKSPNELGSAPTRYVYDATGRLLDEYEANGKPIAEYVYLDDLPVAALLSSGGLMYIESDHLGTPRLLLGAYDDEARWYWPLRII